MKYLILNIFFFSYCIIGSLGFLLKKNNCSIVKYEASNFVKSKSPILISTSNKDLFKKLNEHAKKCVIQINVLESFMLESQRNSSEDKLKINRDSLFIGKGIEFELFDSNKKPICDKTCLINYAEKRVKIDKVDCFFRDLNKTGWKRTKPANIIADKTYDKNLGEYAKLKENKENEFNSPQCESVYTLKYGKKSTTKKVTTTKANKI